MKNISPISHLLFQPSFITYRSSLALIASVALLFSCSREKLTEPDLVIASWASSDASLSSGEGPSSPVNNSSVAGISSAGGASSAVVTSSAMGTSSASTPSSSIPLSSGVALSSIAASSSSLAAPSSAASCPNITATTFTDCRDQQVYSKVTIGSQVWMSQNLNFDTLNATGSWCYSGLAANCTTYGRLYNVKTAQTACPAGWHFPTDSEWQALEIALGMTVGAAATGPGTSYRGTDQGTQLKASSTLWTSNTGSNASGFLALPGGQRGATGTFAAIGTNAYFWTGTASGTNSYYRVLSGAQAGVSRNVTAQSVGFSVRCLQD